MECPEGTVKYRLSAARGKIKQGVQDYENTSGIKLYSSGSVALLTAIFVAESQSLVISNCCFASKNVSHRLSVNFDRYVSNGCHRCRLTVGKMCGRKRPVQVIHRRQKTGTKPFERLKAAHKNLFVYFRAVIADVTAIAVDCNIGICNQPFFVGIRKY